MCGCSCFLSVSVVCHRAHTGIFYVIGYWLFTPFVVLKLLISCTWLNARYPFFPPLEYVHAPTRTDTRSRSHTHTHTLVNKGLRNRGSPWVPPGQPFDCCCFVLQLTSEVFFMKWTARWLQNCGHRHRRRWLLGYAAGSTKAQSAACHATGMYKCQTGQLDYVPSQVHEIAHGIELWHMSHCEGVRACWLRVNDAA